MKQEFLKNQMIESGIRRFSEKYNVGRDVKYIGRKSLTPTLLLVGTFGLAAILGTPDEDSVERARMEQEIISQQLAYSDSLNVNYEGK